MENPNGYAQQLKYLLQQVGYFQEPVYCCERITQGSLEIWKVKIFLRYQGDGEEVLTFQIRHPRITLAAAIRDVFCEALLRLCGISIPLDVANSFGMHPYREEDDSRCRLRLTGEPEGSRCTLLSELTHTTENAYEQALEELDELRDRYADLESRYRHLAQEHTTLLLCQVFTIARYIESGRMGRIRRKRPLEVDPLSPPPSP